MPPDFTFDSILKVLLGSTGAVASMIFGIRWLNADRDKLMGALAQERDARIRVLEEAAKRCAEDRIVMHKEMMLLQAEVRELYRRIASIVSGDCPRVTHTGKVSLIAPITPPEEFTDPTLDAEALDALKQ